MGVALRPRYLKRITTSWLTELVESLVRRHKAIVVGLDVVDAQCAVEVDGRSAACMPKNLREAFDITPSLLPVAGKRVSEEVAGEVPVARRVRMPHPGELAGASNDAVHLPRTEGVSAVGQKHRTDRPPPD